MLAGCQAASSAGYKAAPASPAASPSPLAASLLTLAFGSVLSSQSSSLFESLTNTSASPVTISEANLTGSDFSVAGLDLPMALDPNHSVTFTVTFTPASSNASTGSLIIPSTSGATALNIALSGTGTAQGQLTLSPPVLNFGNVLVGASASLNGSLGASGAGATISAAGTDSSEFVISGMSLPATIANAETAQFVVTFTPATSGSASATLSFASNAANSPARQTLTGSGAVATQHTVSLVWMASISSGVVGYSVYRADISGGPYVKFNSAPQSSTAYTDDSAASGQTYFYVSTAVDDNGAESGYSNQTAATIPSP